MRIQPNNKYGFSEKIHGFVTELDALRQDPQGGFDLSLPEYITEVEGMTTQDKKPFTMEEIFHDLGIEPNRMTVENMISAPYDTRWLVPEIVRAAVRDGLRKAPIYPNLIRSEETIAQPSVVMPKINFSTDTTMDATAEAETIGYGEVSWTHRTVSISKVAKGIQITYEAIRYTNISLVNIFFEDVGVRMGYTLDSKCITCMINGDQVDASYAAPVIGVNDTTDGISYYDLMRLWIRGAMIGRSYQQMVANEVETLKIMNLTEFKDKQAGAPVPLTVKLPMVSNPELYPHICGVTNQTICYDKSFGIVQLTSQPLLVESEKIVQRQIEGTYASMTTGFAKLFRDCAIIIDGANAFNATAGQAYGWPTWMITGYTS